MNTPKVCLIVPVWCNSEASYDMTIKAINGMLDTDYDNFDVVLVDDCSPYVNTFSKLVDIYDAHPLVRCIVQTPDNGGSTNAVNFGISFTDAPFIQYQNNDTLFPYSNWLYEQMCLFDDPAVGVVGSLLRYETGLIQHAGACWRDIGNHAVDHIGQYQKQVKYLEDVPFVTGCGMTVRREVLERNGGGFTVFEGYGWDDIDIQVKAKSWGFKVKVAPKSEFVHLGSVSYKQRPELIDRTIMQHNRQLFDTIEIKPEETINYFIAKYY